MSAQPAAAADEASRRTVVQSGRRGMGRLLRELNVRSSRRWSSTLRRERQSTRMVADICGPGGGQLIEPCMVVGEQRPCRLFEARPVSGHRAHEAEGGFLACAALTAR